MVSFMFSALVVMAFVVVMAKVAAAAVRPLIAIALLVLVARGLAAVGIDPGVAALAVIALGLLAAVALIVRRLSAEDPQMPGQTLAASPPLTAPQVCPACGGRERDHCGRCAGAGWVEAGA
jgi:hypothetical protein